MARNAHGNASSVLSVNIANPRNHWPALLALGGWGVLVVQEAQVSPHDPLVFDTRRNGLSTV